MSNFSALKTAVQQVIKQNGNEEITGAILQEILLSIINTLGDSAINNLETALQTETTNRTNADGTLQQNINTEATTRGEADTALGNLIGAEETARENADTALQGAITAINARLNEGYLYKGIATPTTDPSTPTGRLFYIATAAGTYTNFLDANSQPLVVTKGINILKYNGSWEVQQVVGIDETPTAGSHNLVESGGVQNELALGAVYDVSAKNPTAGPNSDGKFTLEYILDQNNVNTLIPVAYRKGGMSIKFVCSSDNKYVQYLYTGTSTDTADFTNEANWEKTNLEEELIQLNEELNGKDNFTEGGYIKSDNSIQTDDNYCYSDYIPVAAGESITVEYGATSIQLYILCVNDLNVRTDYFSETENHTSRTITIPVGSTKMRFSFTKGNNARVLRGDVVVWKTTTECISDRVEELENKIEDSGISYESLNNSLKEDIDKIPVIEDDISGIEEDVEDLKVDIDGKKNFTTGGYISSINTIVSNEDYCYSDYIPVTPGDSLTIEYGVTVLQLYIVCVDASGVVKDYFSELENNTSRTITIPADSAKMRFSFTKGNIANVKKNNEVIWTSYVEGINDRINNILNELNGNIDYNSLDNSLKEKIDSIDDKLSEDEILVDNNPNLCDFKQSDIVGKSEELTVSLTYNSISMSKTARVNTVVQMDIPAMEEGNTYVLTANANEISSLLRMHYYDENGLSHLDNFSFADGVYSFTFEYKRGYHDVLLCASLPYDVSTVDITNFTIKISGKADKVIDDDLISNLEDKNFSSDFINDSALFDGAPTTYAGNDICIFNKGICIGDSLTAGAFNHNQPTVGVISNASLSYPSKLSQMTGIELDNLGEGGYTTEGWYNKHASDDFSGYDFAIIQLGVNDYASGDTEWPTVDKTAMGNIITKLQNENNNIFIFVATIIPAKSYGHRDYISDGIRDLVEELNDDHVILVDLAEYGHTNDTDAYNCGHLSAYGYLRLAMDYKAYIGYIISHNKMLFQQVQFIGTNYSY